MYNLIIRPLLFCIDPEKVHRMLLSWLKFYRYLFPVRACVRGYSRVSDPFSYGHLQFKNRIGLSAGFDKNAEAFDELADFGFGFLEVGTVTPDSQSGNPSPRIFRLVDDESLISRTGFNNCGVDAVRQHIRKYRKHSYVLGVNINKNPLSTGDQIVKDFESTFIHLYDCVDYFTLNWVDTFYHRIEGYHIAGNLLIFASDYQSLRKDSNRLFYIQQDKFRPVNKILKAYDFVKNRNIAQKNIYSLRKGKRSVFVNNQEYPLLCYDNCKPLPTQQDGSTPFEFTLQEVIDLLHQMEVEYKTIFERETAYTKEHLFLSSSQKSKIKRILGETAHIIENYRNELRIIAHAHEQENREY